MHYDGVGIAFDGTEHKTRLRDRLNRWDNLSSREGEYEWKLCTMHTILTSHSDRREYLPVPSPNPYVPEHASIELVKLNLR